MSKSTLQAVKRSRSRKPINVVRGEYGRRLVVYLSEEQWAALASRADLDKRPIGELARSALHSAGLIPGTPLVSRGAPSHRN